MGLRYTNSGELVETDSGGGLFQNILGKGKDLLKAVIARKFPEASILLGGENSILSGDNSTLGGENSVLSGDGSTYDPNQFSSNSTEYQATTGFDPNQFPQNTNTILSGDNSTLEGTLPTSIGSEEYMNRNTVNDSVVNQKDDFNKKVNVLDIVKDIDEGGSGKKIANQIKDENNLVDAFDDDPINDMLGYAMKNMFGGWGGPKRNPYQIPMMNTAQRGLKY